VKPGGQDLAPEHGIDQLLNGWRAFGEGWVLLDMLVVLVLALVLGAVIAYHPATRRRMSSLEHFEQPKTFLTYSMVAAIVALLVEVSRRWRS
jgi:short subunit fatty acids transporter